MASKLSIGLISSPGKECEQMVQLLKGEELEIRYNVLPADIKNEQIEDNQLSVWLLNVNDDDWHDNIDLLLDESETSIYFNEPGTLAKQDHPEFWCKSLVSRLYEITGLTNDSSEVSEPNDTVDTTKEKRVEQPVSESIDDLSFALDELESNAVDLPSEVAADLVSELESISPDLDAGKQALSFDSAPSLKDSKVVGISEPQSELPSEPELGLELALEPALEAAAVSPPEPDVLLEDDFSEYDSYDSLGDGSFDDLDFAGSNTPILESARDDLDNVLESSFSLSDQADSSAIDKPENLDEPLQSVELDTPISNVPQSQAIALEEIDDIGLSLEEMTDDSNEVEIASTEKQTNPAQDMGTANFLPEEDENTENLDEEISLDDLFEDSLSESDGLSLESMDLPPDPPITGKAVYLEESATPETTAMKSSQEDALEGEFEDELSSLSLELTEEEVPSGKAVFVEEEIEIEAPKKPEDTTPTLDDGGLTLEFDEEFADSHPTTGRAEYTIDETDLDNGSLETLAQDLSNQELSEPDLLKPDLPEQEQQTLQDDPSSNEDPIDDADQLQMSKSVELLTPGEESEEAKPGADTDADADTVTVETFEIPMLEESVMDVDFDEPASLAPQVDPLTPCWVIGASLGGPAAVKRFFQSVPSDINACFVVVQHIDESFLSVMAEILTSNSHFEVEVANGSNVMRPGKVYLAPLKGKIVFLQDGSMFVDHSQKWSQPYSPCIDDVIDSMASVYGELGGSIIFSGMGEDGLKGCEKLAAAGGIVWAQSADTCANSSMPDAIINADLARVIATPEMLADQLAKTLSETVYG